MKELGSGTMKLKESLLFWFIISAVASYFLAYGYFKAHGINVTNYLSIEDIILIYSKNVWVTIAIAYILILVLENFFSKLDERIEVFSWWHKTVKRTIVKNGVFILVPVLGISILILYYSTEIRSFVFLLVGFLFISLIFLGYGRHVFGRLILVGRWDELKSENRLEIVIAVFMYLFLLPFIIGLVSSNNIHKDRISFNVEWKREVIIADGDSLEFIGNTSKFFFIKDKKNGEMLIFPIEKMSDIRLKKNEQGLW